MRTWEETVVAYFKPDHSSCLDEMSKITRNIMKCSRSPRRYEMGVSWMRAGSSDRFSLDPVCRQSCIRSSFRASIRCRVIYFSASACICQKWKFVWLETSGRIRDQQRTRQYTYYHVTISQVQCAHINGWGRNISPSSLTRLLVISKRTNRFLITVAADYVLCQ
jgi:hypothetical protein